MTRPHAFQDQQTLTLADEEYRTVAEGRIRIRIGVIAFVFMLLIAIVRLAEISLFSSDEHRGNLPCPFGGKGTNDGRAASGQTH